MGLLSKKGIHASINEQFVYESVVSAFLLFVGVGGFLRIHTASKYAYDSIKSFTNLIIGIILVVLATYALLISFSYKTGITL